MTSNTLGEKKAALWRWLVHNLPLIFCEAKGYIGLAVEPISEAELEVREDKKPNEFEIRILITNGLAKGHPHRMAGEATLTALYEERTCAGIIFLKIKTVEIVSSGGQKIWWPRRPGLD